MPRAWRMVKQRYAADAFSGEGARLYGGRWNSPGVRAVYAGEHLSLAALEILAHLGRSDPLAGFVVFTVDFEDSVAARAALETLPANWRASPVPAAARDFGDVWLRANSGVLLAVPSAVIPEESNRVINPAHPDFARLKIDGPRPFDFDPRLAAG